MAPATSTSNPTTSPLRLLILTPTPTPATPSPFSALLESLTGVPTPPQQQSFAGYTQHQPLKLETKYYAANVGIWCDEVPTFTDANAEDTLETWKAQMLSPEAAEVRAAVGGFVVVLGVAAGKVEVEAGMLDLVEAVEEVRGMGEDESGREVPGVVVLQGNVDVEGVEGVEERLLIGRGVLGWDVVAWSGVVGDFASGKEDMKNEFGEKSGLARLREVLEAVAWDAGGRAGGEVLDGEIENEARRIGEDGVRIQGFELEREIMGLKLAMRENEDEDEDGSIVKEEAGEIKDEDDLGKDEWPRTGGSEEIKVEQLQGLMERVIAIREAGAEMGTVEREKFVKSEMERILKELG